MMQNLSIGDDESYDEHNELDVTKPRFEGIRKSTRNRTAPAHFGYLLDSSHVEIDDIE